MSLRWRRGISWVCAGLLLGASGSVSARQDSWERCFVDAGARYGVNPLLLRAIARQESSFRADAIGKNTNGTRDLGVMQINTWWLTTLSPAGIDESKLMDPCLNIHVGAWILANEIARHGLTWTAVGAYHSPTDWRRADYALRVNRHLVRELRALGVEVPDAPAVEKPRPSPQQSTAVEVTAVADSGPGVWESVAASDKPTPQAAPVDTFRPQPKSTDPQSEGSADE